MGIFVILYIILIKKKYFFQYSIFSDKIKNNHTYLLNDYLLDSPRVIAATYAKIQNFYEVIFLFILFVLIIVFRVVLQITALFLSPFVVFNILIRLKRKKEIMYSFKIKNNGNFLYAIKLIFNDIPRAAIYKAVYLVLKKAKKKEKLNY
jgi:hypothetical protein